MAASRQGADPEAAARSFLPGDDAEVGEGRLGRFCASPNEVVRRPGTSCLASTNAPVAMAIRHAP